jgi:acrylyl-CoA reductase (NADPH)
VEEVDVKALLLENRDDRVQASVQDIDPARLPDQGALLVAIEWSSLNFKDALAVTNSAPIVRATYPFVPGIDMAGRVIDGSKGEPEPGSSVIVTGWGIGENYWGGFAQLQRVRPDWTVPCPAGLSTRSSMILGTAGLTAMLSVMAIESGGVKADAGEIVVTGATGGVGSLATYLLSRSGYDVVASTDDLSAAESLSRLGAVRVVHRDLLAAGPEKVLDSSRWAGAVDVVGGSTLGAILSQVRRHGVVAACGLAGSPDLITTVYPFILRGVSLHGIDSTTCPRSLRSQAWRRLSEIVDAPTLEFISREIALSEVAAESRAMLDQGHRGRVIVNVNR